MYVFEDSMRWVLCKFFLRTKHGLKFCVLFGPGPGTCPRLILLTALNAAAKHSVARFLRFGMAASVYGSFGQKILE